MDHRMNHWVGRVVGSLLFVATLAAGCSYERVAMEMNVPGASAGATISLEAERGDYLDVTTASAGKSYRFFLPNTDACRSLFVSELAVSYTNVGSFGQLSAGEAICDPVGVLSLVAWRNRGPRRRYSEMIPRSQAELRQVIYEDADLALVRGRFLLAREIGILGGGDLIAVIPRVETCEGILAARSASMEFRPAGKQPLTLINAGQRCPVLGFVQPPANP